MFQTSSFCSKHTNEVRGRITRLDSLLTPPPAAAVATAPPPPPAQLDTRANVAKGVSVAVGLLAAPAPHPRERPLPNPGYAPRHCYSEEPTHAGDMKREISRVWTVCGHQRHLESQAA